MVDLLGEGLRECVPADGKVVLFTVTSPRSKPGSPLGIGVLVRSAPTGRFFTLSAATITTLTPH
jgi:hypothetical protein